LLKAPKEKIRQCYKVHIEEEAVKRQGTQRITKWVEKNSKSEKKQRILSFWCFNPGFGLVFFIDKVYWFNVKFKF